MRHCRGGQHAEQERARAPAARSNGTPDAAALGHGRFAVAGHDRGRRVTHRLLGEPSRQGHARRDASHHTDALPFRYDRPEGGGRQLALVLSTATACTPHLSTSSSTMGASLRSNRQARQHPPTSPPLISKRTTSGRRSSTCTRGRRHLGLAGLSLPGSQIRVAELVQSGCDLDLQPRIGGRSLACDQPGEPALSPFLLSLIHHRHGQERPRVLTVVLFPAPRRGGSRKVRVDFQAGPRVRRLVWGFSVKWLFRVALTVFCSERERPFFVPSPAIRFAERAEGVKGPKR